MSQRTIHEIAEGFGLSVDKMTIPENGDAFRIYKGANQVFIGSEEAVREYFVEYEKERPTLYEGSMYGYRE